MNAVRIEADVLVPGRGAPVPDGVLVSEGERITYAGAAAAAPETPHAEVVRAPVVMPGLWECHSHLGGLPPSDPVNFGRYATEPAAVRAARAVRDVQAALAGGVTSIREVGGLGVYIGRVIDEGTLSGPSIYAAGGVLSTTGGHTDIHDLPLAWVREWAEGGGDFRPCDGPAECAKAAREQLRKGARVLKLCASGGTLSVLDDPLHQQFTVAEMRAVVEVAGMAERVVAAHAHGKVGIMTALEAGVRTIEHGTYLDEEAADAMRETGAVLVATRSIQELLRTAPGLPPHVRRKAENSAAHHAEAIATAHAKGVTFAAGADIAISDPTHPFAWGNSAKELPLLVGLGLSPLEAIEAATANGPLTVGLQAPRSGQLAAGYDADFLTLAHDPVANIAVFDDPKTVTGVWKSGRRVA